MTLELPPSWGGSGDLKVAGVDIGGTQCSVNAGQVSDGALRLVTRDQFATRVERGPEQVLVDIERRLSMLWDGKERPSVIGVSCGGPLDADRGVVQSPPNLPGWDDIAIVARLEASLGVPCALENDANACVLAEWGFGSGKGLSNVVYLTFGTGLGAGMVLQGKLHRGTGGLAGEVGHWQLGPYSGPEVYRKRGSFEGYCSGNGIAQWFRYLGGASPDGERPTAKVVAALARDGEPIAVRVFKQAAEQLGAGIAMIVDLLAPELVAVGGVFVYANDLLRDGMYARFLEEVHPGLVEKCRVVPAALGETLGSYASCCVAVEAALGQRGATLRTKEGTRESV